VIKISQLHRDRPNIEQNNRFSGLFVVLLVYCAYIVTYMHTCAYIGLVVIYRLLAIKGKLS